MPKKYDQEHPLLDAIISEKDLYNDAHLARFMQYKPGVISKVRNGKVHVSDEFRLRVMRKTGWSLAKIDKLCPPDGA